MIFEQLKQFRQTIYECLGTGKDATFELMDAVLTSPSITSFVSLSQNPMFRRKWASIYGALHQSKMKRSQLRKQLVKQIAVESQPVIGGDSSLWPRPEAKTLRDRGFHHNGSQGIGVGHSYSTLAWIPDEKGSWALPLRHERITSFETALTKASFQLKQVCRQLTVRPLAVFDRNYGNGSFLKQTAEIATDLLIRIASNRCVYAKPGAYSGRGAPRKHGAKFKLNDLQTHPEPDEILEVDDPKLGQIRVTRWSQFHFRNCATKEMDVIRVEIIQPNGRKRKFKPLWLIWTGQIRPPISQLWRQYLQRFSLEHWYRFAKQRLFWTKPKLNSHQACECWSDLVVLMSWQLWFARLECDDCPLPWQSPQQILSPGRVAQAFPAILASIGTCADPPKTRGKSSGRLKGYSPSPRSRYPTIKKRVSRRKKSKTTTKVTA